MSQSEEHRVIVTCDWCGATTEGLAVNGTITVGGGRYYAAPPPWQVLPALRNPHATFVITPTNEDLCPVCVQAYQDAVTKARAARKAVSP